MNTYTYVGVKPSLAVDPTGEFFGLSHSARAGYAVGTAISGYVAIKYGTSLGSLIYDWVHSESNSNEGGSATTRAPYEKGDEAEALAFVPDPFGGDEACRQLAWAINVLRSQFAWRRTDLNPASASYATNAKRIAVLSAALQRLEQSYRNICGKDCPPT